MSNSDLASPQPAQSGDSTDDGDSPSHELAEVSEKRERWSSRPAFIFAAIGSAVGIGNLWRFPYQCFKHGGGAFFIPYLLALFFVGIPILQMEFALGQVHQGGHLKSFDRIGRRWRGLGFAAPIFAFLIATYYCVILGWSLIYMMNCFQHTMPWAVPAEAARDCPDYQSYGDCEFVETCQWNDADGVCGSAVLKRALDFFESALNVAEVGEPMTLSGSGAVVGALAFTWLCVYLAVFRGTRFLGYVVYFTMIVPLLLLIVITGRGVTLPGAKEGMKAYIGEWDMSTLSTQKDMWSGAVGQIFFSVGVCYGVMTAYASFNKRGQNVAQDAFIVSLSNSAVSVVSGLAVFSIAGFLSHESGQSLEEIKSAGVGLVFLTFPTGLAQLPTPAAQIFTILFFLTFFLLGIDSAFSLAEALMTTISDSRGGQRMYRFCLVLVACVCGFLLGLTYATNIGLHLLDCVDYYINNVATLVVGLCECIAAGWWFGRSEQAKRLGWPSVVVFAFTYFCAVIAGIGLGFGLGGVAGKIVAPMTVATILVVGVAASILLTHRFTNTGESLSFWRKIYWMTLGNVECLRSDLNEVISINKSCGCFTCPTIMSSLTIVWSILIKYVIPIILLFLLGTTFSGDFLAYGDPPYPKEYQVLGLVIAVLGVSLIAFAFAAPGIFSPFVPPREAGEMEIEESEDGPQYESHTETFFAYATAGSKAETLEHRTPKYDKQNEKIDENEESV